MIKINDDYIVDNDQYCYIAKKHIGTKTNKEGEKEKIYKTLGYYQDLKSAVVGLVKYETKEIIAAGEFTLSEAVDIINKTTDKFQNILDAKIKNPEDI